MELLKFMVLIDSMGKAQEVSPLPCRKRRMALMVIKKYKKKMGQPHEHLNSDSDGMSDSTIKIQ